MERGFSLLELMIAVAVMAILTLIAYPSYNSYMASAKRAEAKAALLEAAQYMERQFTADGNYDGGNLASAGLATLPRDGGAAYYNLALNASGARYTLTAIPTGVMNGDPCGLLTLDQGGAAGGVDGQHDGRRVLVIRYQQAAGVLMSALLRVRVSQAVLPLLSPTCAPLLVAIRV